MIRYIQPGDRTLSSSASGACRMSLTWREKAEPTTYLVPWLPTDHSLPCASPSLPSSSAASAGRLVAETCCDFPQHLLQADLHVAAGRYPSVSRACSPTLGWSPMGFGQDPVHGGRGTIIASMEDVCAVELGDAGINLLSTKSTIQRSKIETPC
jgi:hypothetical protein